MPCRALWVVTRFWSRGRNRSSNGGEGVALDQSLYWGFCVESEEGWESSLGLAGLISDSVL